MLAKKLLKVTAANKNIQFIGGRTLSGIGDNNYSIPLGAGLTGGISESASNGDTVLIYFAVGAQTDVTPTVWYSSNGITLTGRLGTRDSLDLYANDFYDANLYFSSFKITDFPNQDYLILEGGAQGSAHSGVCRIEVWRNVQSVEIGSTTSVLNQASITIPNISTSVEGCIEVCAASGASNYSGDYLVNSNLDAAYRANDAASHSNIALCVGHVLDLPINTNYSPGQFTFPSSSSSYSAAAFSAYLTPED